MKKAFWTICFTIMVVQMLTVEKAKGQWVTTCGLEENSIGSCKVQKIEGVRLGGADGYIVQYVLRDQSIYQWWLPDGTGTCWWKNTYFRPKAGEWKPVNAYCDGNGRTILRRIEGTILFVVYLDG
jgi:hypothetical protein